MAEQMQAMKDTNDSTGDDYKAQLQGMLSQKQQVQDQLSQIENELSRTTKERDKQKLIATQQASQISELKDWVQEEAEQAKALQGRLHEAQTQHMDEVKRLKADM